MVLAIVYLVLFCGVVGAALMSPSHTVKGPIGGPAILVLLFTGVALAVERLW